ncbi:MAG: hypothetical protein NW224_17390 [Leptolyngbyaceae cyanobacterium bins.302]|nr:hypothetical protein [Leptolyngbyaceae cyanobacterium bins.302]
MATTEPLQDTELVDCARANGTQGMNVAAELCGYGTDLDAFEHALKQACDRMGITYETFSDLLKPPTTAIQELGEIVAPDTPDQL